MTRVQWSVSGERRFETGVDRGMFYPAQGTGVAWNGLTKVSETPTGGTPKEMFLDGEKVLSLFTLEEFAATIEAFSSPREFNPCAGLKRLSVGFFAANQPRLSFGFSYRTLTGDDLQGIGAGYKLHLVYNALTKTSDFVNSSITGSSDVAVHSWAITTVPETYVGFKPVAHFVLDSRKVDPSDLGTIEDILYGTNFDDPRMLSATELEVILYGTGSWFSVASGVIARKKMTIAGQILAADNTSFITGGVSRKKMKISGTGAGISVGTGIFKREKIRIIGSGSGGINQSGLGYIIGCYSPVSLYQQGDSNLHSATVFNSRFSGQTWATNARKVFSFASWPASPANLDLMELVNLGCQIWYCCKPDPAGADIAGMNTFLINWLKYMPPEQLVMVPYQEPQGNIDGPGYLLTLHNYAPTIHSHGIKIAYDASGSASPAKWAAYTPPYTDFDIIGGDYYATIHKSKTGGTESGGIIINKTNTDPLAQLYAIADNSPGGRMPFCLPELGSSIEPSSPVSKAWFTDYITYVKTLLKARKDAGKPGSATMWYNGNGDNPNTNTIYGPKTTIASGSNGGNIRNIATWANPAPGELAVASTTAEPFDPTPSVHAPTPLGRLFVQLDSGVVANITYTGISGNRFIGCQWISGAGNVATGALVALFQFDSGTTSDWREPIMSDLYATIMRNDVSTSLVTGSIKKKKMKIGSSGGPVINPYKIGSAYLPTGSVTRVLPVVNGTSTGTTIVVLPSTNSATNYAASVTDSQGNIYTQVAVNTAVPNLIAWVSDGATGGSDGGATKYLTTSDTIIITMNSTLGILTAFAVALAPSLVDGIDVVESPVAVGNSVTMAATATPTQNEDIALALYAWGQTGGALSSTAPYTSLGSQQAGTGSWTGASFRNLSTGTSGIAQTANATITADTWKACMLLFKRKVA